MHILTLVIWIVECGMQATLRRRMDASLRRVTFAYLLSKLLSLFLTAWERVDEVSNLDANPSRHIGSSDL